MLDVIISLRDREQERVERCVNALRQSKHINEIYVMDNSLKTTITPIKGAKIIRLDYSGYWNKSWVLNKGIKLSKADYIMTIDVDIILSEEHLDLINKYLDKNTVIFNKNVKRLNPEFISKNYKKMVANSYPWYDNPRSSVYHEANGGIQVFPTEWIKSVNGYDENAGLLWGGMDNRVFEQAIMDGMVVVDINKTMVHVDHPDKEDSLDVKDRYYGKICRELKLPYLNDLIAKKQIKNSENWGGDIPNDGYMRKITEEKIKKLP